MQPPLIDCVKINTDGAVRGSFGQATADGILRDAFGCWKGGFSYNISCCSVIQVELWGILMGLRVAWNKGNKNIQLETDSMTAATRLLSNEIDAVNANYGLIQEIRNMPAESGWSVSNKSIGRLIYVQIGWLIMLLAMGLKC